MAIRVFLLFLCLLAGSGEGSDPLQRIEELRSSGSMKELIPLAQSLLETPSLSLENKGRLRYYLGEAYAALNQPQEAIRQLLEVERSDPESPFRLDAYRRLKTLYGDDPTRHQSVLEKIFTLFPATEDAVAAGRELAERHLLHKTYSRAVEVLETMYKLWKTDDPDGRIRMQLAAAHAGLRDYVEAADYLEEVEEKHRDLLLREPAFILTAAQIRYSTQHFREAVSLLERLINVYPSSPLVLDAAVLLAKSQENSKNPFLGAVTLIQAMRDRSPGVRRHEMMLLLGQLLSLLSQEERDQLAKSYPGMTDIDQLLRQVYTNAQEPDLKRQACQILARDLRNRGQVDRASELYLDYLQKNRETEIIRKLRDTIDEWLSRIRKEGDQKALRSFWSSFQNKKSFLSANNLIGLARLLVSFEQYSAAEEVLTHIRRYRMYEPHWPEAQEHRMLTFLRTQRYEELRQALDEIPEQVKNDSRFRWFAWQLAEATQADDQTIGGILENLPPLNPGVPASWSLHLAAADRMIEKKEFSSARIRLQEIAARADIPATQKPDLTRRFALLDFHQGNLEQALKLYRELAGIPEEEPWALFRQITILNRLGRDEEALLLTRQLKSRFPDSYWSRQIP